MIRPSVTPESSALKTKQEKQNPEASLRVYGSSPSGLTFGHPAKLRFETKQEIKNPEASLHVYVAHESGLTFGHPAKLRFETKQEDKKS